MILFLGEKRYFKYIISNSEELKIINSFGYIFQLEFKNDNNINNNYYQLYNKLRIKILKIVINYYI